MLVLYDKTESNFISNGLAVLDKYCLSAVVREEVNNTFVLNAVFPSKFPHLDKIDYDRIIKAPTPDGEQPFRIYMIRKLFGRIYVSAKHVFFDLEDNLIEDTFIQKQTGAGALNQILKSTQFTHKFSGTSDILNTNNSRLVDKNVVTALIGDQDNSFVNRWGGEIEVDKWDIRFNKVRGKDRGIQILYRKNLTGLDAILNKKTVCTRVLVKGYDGLTLPERYIDSPLINNYPNPIIQEVKFSNIKVKENEDDEGFDTKEEALEALREAGKQLFSIEHIDIPETSYTINFVELSKTEEYKKYKILETLWLGDTVTVRHDDLCIDVKARCVAYDFNSLTKKYINIELGKVKDSINKEINKEIDKIQEEINDSKGFLDDAINAATNMINSGLGGYVTKTRDELLIMDTEDKMTASKVWRWNLNGLGFSKNGYLGPFETAITRDGKFVINSVTANKISAAMIEAGVLSSLNNRTWINLENGTFNFHDKMKFDGTNLSINLNNGKTIEEEIRSNITINAQELNNKIEKITATSNNNLLKNGAFKNQLNNWIKNGEPTINLNVNYLSPSYGDMSLVIANTNEGIYQHIKTIPGQTYTVSFYAECDNLIPCHTRIGIQDSVMINLYDTPRFKYYSFTFTAWNTSHPFMVYANQENAKFFIGRIMINTGDIALPFSNNLDEIAEIQKKNSKIEQTVDTISNTLEKINGDYTSKSTFEQTVNEFNFKFENTGGENIVANSDFSGGNTFWTCVNGAILTPHANWIDNSYGRMARVTCDKHNSGITQYLKTIPGQTYTVSFYAEAEGRRPLSTQIGILDSITIDLEISPSFKRYSFTFTAWNTVHPFIAYTNNTTGTFYIGRIMVTHGSVLQEYRKKSDEIFSNNTKISGDGITVTHNNGSSVNINSRETSFWDKSGLKTIGIKGNGLEFISPTTGAWTSFLKASMSGERRGTTFSASGTGDYVSFGCSKNTDINSADWSTSSGITLNNKYNGAWWPGIHFWAMDTADKDNTFVHNHTSYIQESGNIYMNGQSILFDSYGHSSPNWIGKTNNDRLGIFGDNNVVIGTRHGTTNRSAILISEGSDYDYIQSWCPWDMHGYTLSNANVAYSVANVQSKAYTEDTVLKSYTTSTRYIYKDVQIKNNKIILSIPNVYKGCKYTICSIVKKGSGDVWVDKEFANYFIIKAESNIKVNVEIDVKDKENSIMPINKQRIRDTEEVASTDIAPISPEITR